MRPITPTLSWLLLILTLLLFPMQAQSQEITVTQADFSKRLAAGIEYMEDAAGTLTLEEVRALSQAGHFKAFEQETLQMGYSDSAFWIKLNLLNQLPSRIGQNKEDRFYLSVLYPLLDDVRFYHLRAQHLVASYNAGDHFPFQQRLLKLNSFSYPFVMKPGERSSIFIRVQSKSSISIPLYLETEQAFLEHEHQRNSFNGIYFGISIGLCIYNIFLWLGIRKQVYGLYVLVIVNLMLFNATMQGYSFRFWPESVAFQQFSIYLFSTTSAIAICLFGQAFLRMRDYQPRFHQFIKLIVYVYLLLIPVILMASTKTAAHINVIVTVSGVFIIFIAAFRSLLQGYKPARYYLIGQGAVLFSVFFTVLTSQGIIPLYYLAPEVMKWTSAFELIFFSIGVADLVNNERKLREIAQQESAQAQQELLDSQIQLTEKLDDLVRKRTDELEIANNRLRDLNTMDELTGLRNRRYLNEVLPREYCRAYRDKNPISLLIFDIDYFKKINDTFGHQFGDLCLIEAGRIIRDNLNRAADIALRYGGEEFIAILPQTDNKGAVSVAENIRLTLANQIISDEKHSASMTISIGVATEIPDKQDNFEQLIKVADQRLYRAKDNGRNQVVSEENAAPETAI